MVPQATPSQGDDTDWAYFQKGYLAEQRYRLDRDQIGPVAVLCRVGVTGVPGGMIPLTIPHIWMGLQVEICI